MRDGLRGGVILHSRLSLVSTTYLPSLVLALEKQLRYSWISRGAAVLTRSSTSLRGRVLQVYQLYVGETDLC